MYLYICTTSSVGAPRQKHDGIEKLSGERQFGERFINKRDEFHSRVGGGSGGRMEERNLKNAYLPHRVR